MGVTTDNAERAEHAERLEYLSAGFAISALNVVIDV
jgi:hypothetical protein